MRIPRTLIALPVVLTLGLTLGGPIAVADPPQPPGTKASPAGKEHRSAKAEATLDRVQALVGGRGASQRSSAKDGRDLTVALRDLRMQMDDLSPADRRVAERYLLRPGDGDDPYIDVALPLSKCGPEICVHYRESGGHAAKGSDGNSATIPPYINQVLNTIEQINTDYVAAGYRTPKRDGSLGGDSNKIDIYIGDIGGQGLYGFCSSDDPNDPSVSGDYSFWAYCALDNDYRAGQFPTNTPLENMRVTAAHEFFHAVQFAYDAYEDGWILESTATWVEDEMFDDVNDSRNYLRDSPLTRPQRSLDRFGGLFHYGAWIWWRYLTEKFPAKTGKLPKLVLDVWKRLDGTPGAPDNYSTQGLARVLAARNTSLKREFQLFSAGNRHPGKTYSEGASYPASKPALTFGLTRAKPAKAGNGPISHLASATVRFNPKRLTQRNWKLRLTFDLPPTSRGAAAVVTVYKKGGKLSKSIVRLNRKGNGAKVVPFSSRSVVGVDAVLVNTSARFTCWQSLDSPYSCLGAPKDDKLPFKVTGRAFR